MSNYTMNQDTLQSYFKSLCNSFYIAYEQVKQLEKLAEELESTCPDEELEIVERCLKVYELEEWQQKYIMQKYSKEELEKQKERLEMAKKEYDEKCEELERPYRFWNNSLWERGAKNISGLLGTMKENGFSIIVTNREEIIALMAFFRERSVKEYRIINTDEQYLKSFPTGEKMYEEFYAAYCLEDDKEMEKVIHKYF